MILAAFHIFIYLYVHLSFFFKRAERADRKYISIKIEGDKNDYSIEEILEKLGEADKVNECFY